MAKQKEIFSGLIDDMFNNSPKVLLHIQHYLSANCFGEYVAKEGLHFKIRERVTLSLLIALGGAENQIKGHMVGNAKVGNDSNPPISLITQLIPYVGYPRTLKCYQLFE
jgi:4-carboxymuconolactone decarboxylase